MQVAICGSQTMNARRLFPRGATQPFVAFAKHDFRVGWHPRRPDTGSCSCHGCGDGNLVLLLAMCFSYIHGMVCAALETQVVSDIAILPRAGSDAGRRNAPLILFEVEAAAGRLTGVPLIIK